MTSLLPGTAMVPLLAAMLAVVVASQVPKLDGNLGDVAAVVPFYVLFLVVMAFAGRAVARLFRLDVPAGRAVLFTGAARNSLVVLPLVLALSDRFAVAAVVVVTQTLIEVLGMVAYVRLIPGCSRTTNQPPLPGPAATGGFPVDRLPGVTFEPRRTLTVAGTRTQRPPELTDRHDRGPACGQPAAYAETGETGPESAHAERPSWV